jgi:hypothetical protein
MDVNAAMTREARGRPELPSGAYRLYRLAFAYRKILLVVLRSFRRYGVQRAAQYGIYALFECKRTVGDLVGGKEKIAQDKNNHISVAQGMWLALHDIEIRLLVYLATSSFSALSGLLQFHLSDEEISMGLPLNSDVRLRSLG